MEEVRKWGYEDTHAKSQGISVEMLKKTHIQCHKTFLSKC